MKILFYILMWGLPMLPLIFEVVSILRKRKELRFRNHVRKRWGLALRIEAALGDAKTAMAQMTHANDRGDFESAAIHEARVEEILEYVESMKTKPRSKCATDSQ